MSSPLVPSALDARTQAFPVLSVSQIDRIRSCSRSRQVAASDILFEPGDENVPFYVLLSGGMEIVQPDLAGEHLIARHGPGEFSGEMTMISGRRCLVRGRVTEPGEFLELTGDGLRSLVARDAELSDIFMRAFILRRLQLISQGQGNVILLGSRHSANTLRLREFLSRNGYPYRYVDLDTDNTSQELLDRFEVTPSEIPVVICSGRSVLRNPSNQDLADCLGFNATINESQVRDALRRAQALRFVERLPGGLAEEIRERGANLSAGQRQLLSFARALAYNPRILVMDEATSSVDSETERLIQLALNELLAERTAVVIAHRLSTIERADRIMVLGGGMLRESGTHDELLAQRGLYYRLFELQYAAMANSDRLVAG